MKRNLLGRIIGGAVEGTRTDLTSDRTALLRSAKALVVMRDPVSDVAAVTYAKLFYGGIASGQSLQSALEQGVVVRGAHGV